MRKKLTIFLLFSVFIFCFANEVSARKWWTTSVRRLLVTQAIKMNRSAESFFLQLGYRQLGDSLIIPSTEGHAGDVFMAKNVAGDTLVQGDVVVFDNSPISVVATVARVADVDTLVIADSLNGETWPLTLYSTTFSLGDACSLDIYGIPYGSTSQVKETIVHATTGTKYSITNQYWTKINLAVMRSFAANDSILIGAYHTNAVTTTTSGDATNPAGVVYSESALDNTWLLVMRRGYLSNVKIDAASVEAIPGRKFNTSTTAAKGAPVSSPVAGAGIGTILEAMGSDGTCACWINVE